MFEWTTQIVIGVCVNVLISALTMPAGIGGGIMFVPVMRLIGGMDEMEASSFSQVLIAGASIGSIIFQFLWQYRHPTEPLLAQPFLVLICLPCLLAGSVVGVYLNGFLPSVVSLIILVILCIISSVYIFKKGVAAYKKESLIAEAGTHGRLAGSIDSSVASTCTFDKDQYVSACSGDIPNFLASPSIRSACENPDQWSIENDLMGIMQIEGTTCVSHEEPPPQSYFYEECVVIPSHPPSVVSISSLRRLKREKSSFRTAKKSAVSQGVIPTVNPDLRIETTVETFSKFLRFVSRTVLRFVGFTTIFWGIWIAITVFRGSRSNPSFAGFPPCEAVYWAITVVQIVIGIALSLAFSLREYKMIIGTFGAGLVATVTGASGGIMLNPMFLHMGLDPQQVAATSSVIMLFLSSSSSIQFLVAGKIEPILTTMVLTTLGGAVIGMTAITWVVNKAGRQSYLIFLLGGLVVAGCAMLLSVGISDLVSITKAGENPFAFRDLC